MIMAAAEALAEYYGVRIVGLAEGARFGRAVPRRREGVGVAAVAAGLVAASAYGGGVTLATGTDASVVAAGSMLMGWIAVEAAVVREPSLLDPLNAGIGLAMALAGRHSRLVQDRRWVSKKAMMRRRASAADAS